MFRIILVLIAVFLLGVLTAVQYYVFNGFDNNYFNGLILNLSTDAISILITVLIVDQLLKKQERKEEKKVAEQRRIDQERLIKEIIGNSLVNLFSELSSVYINFVTKEPLITKKENKNFENHEKAIIDIIDNIDEYVGAEFRSYPVKTIIVDASKLSEGFPVERIISYQEFCSGVFKSKVNFIIEGFITRYISILPDDLRKALYRIENVIGDFVFVTFYELGFKNQPMPTTENDIEKLKEQLLIIGEDLLYIHSLIK